MFSSTAYAIHLETDQHDATLRRLAALDEQAPLRTPALIGHIGGTPAAAVSIVDDRTVADPFIFTEPLRVVLRTRAKGIRTADEEPSVQRRIIARLRHVFRRPRRATA